MASINLPYLPSRLGCGFRSPRRRATRFLVHALNREDSSVLSSSQRVMKTVISRSRKNRFLVIYASNSNPSGEDTRKHISSRGDADSQGPPFLTILAGFFVFVLVLWLTGSILTWLLGLVANLLQLR